MLNVTLTILALFVACLLVWFAMRRSKMVQRVSENLSGPVEQMQEQILLTADTAIDRLDSKIAQMEILLAEIDRRSNLLAQQSQQLQMRQLQCEQQQQQMMEWLQKQRQQIEQELVLRQQAMARLPQPAPVLEIASPVRPNSARTQPLTSLKPALREMPTEPARMTQEQQIVAQPPIPATGVKPAIKTTAQSKPLVKDKRTMILDMAEQGWSVTDIAQKMGIGKGEVMLLLKLRKKTVE